MSCEMQDALLMELRNMNEEFLQKEKETDSLSDLEHFKRQHTMVFFQLQEANDQVKILKDPFLYLLHKLRNYIFTTMLIAIAFLV